MYQAFCYGGSVVHKHMIMQAHEQCNAMEKRNGGAVGLASLRRVLFVNLHDYRISMRRVLFVDTCTFCHP